MASKNDHRAIFLRRRKKSHESHSSILKKIVSIKLHNEKKKRIEIEPSLYAKLLGSFMVFYLLRVEFPAACDEEVYSNKIKEKKCTRSKKPITV